MKPLTDAERMIWAAAFAGEIALRAAVGAPPGAVSAGNCVKP